MKLFLEFVFLTLALAIIGCGPKSDRQTFQELTLVQNKGFGPGPSYSVSIDYSGRVSFQGLIDVGTQSASEQLSPVETQRIIDTVGRADLNRMVQGFGEGGKACVYGDLDSRWLELTIKKTGGVSRFNYSYGCHSSEETVQVEQLVDAIEEIAGVSAWAIPPDGRPDWR